MKKKVISLVLLSIAISLVITSCKQIVYRDRVVVEDSSINWQTFFETGLYPTGAPQNITINGQKVVRYRTSKNENMYDRYLDPIVVKAKAHATTNYIEIDPNDTRQTMLGVGGSFTDTTLYNLERTSKKNQDLFWEQYFGKNGSQYTMTRITLGSADFSTKFYDYDHDPSLDDDKNGKASRNNYTPDPGIFKNPNATDPKEKYKDAGDITLQWFKLSERDTDHIIPALKKANSYIAKYKDDASKFPNGAKELTVFAAPWSPPAWMKNGANETSKKNGQRPGGNAMGGLWQQIGIGEYANHSVNKNYYPAYARYFSSYLEAMKANGIQIFQLSLQNESQNHPSWEMCLWNSGDAATFIANHLGPEMVRTGFKPSTKKSTDANQTRLAVWDWDRTDFGHADGMEKWCKAILGNSNAASYIDAIAFHWYGGLGNSGASWGRNFDRIKLFAGTTYKMHMYASEACQENGPVLHEWFPASRYIYDMINVFEAGGECWIDWNLLLDENGGPQHEVSNPCHAPVHVDTKGNDAPDDDILIFNPCYYILKRMSLEVRPGAVCIGTTSDLTNDKNNWDENANNDGDIYKVAFKEPDGSISLLVGNIPHGNYTDAGKSYTISIGIKDTGSSFTDEIPPHSFTVYKFTNDYKKPEPILASAGFELKDVPTGKYSYGVLNVRQTEVKKFKMLTTEVTQKLYEDVSQPDVKTNPFTSLGANKGDNKPAVNLTFAQMAEFCNDLSLREDKDAYYIIKGTSISTNEKANGFRLPTKQEWLWAAMGATKGPNYVSSDSFYKYKNGFAQAFTCNDVTKTESPKDLAWYKDNSENTLHDIATKEIDTAKKKKANALGLYDMSGNAAELCWQTSSTTVSGGSYASTKDELKIGTQPNYNGSKADTTIGFRVVCPAD